MLRHSTSSGGESEAPEMQQPRRRAEDRLSRINPSRAAALDGVVREGSFARH